MAELDLVVRGGSVVDGSGAPARTADVGVRDGHIVEVGRVTSTADRVIDADGALVTPGFVDIHTHYDGQATWDTRMWPSSWHGVTTVVMGNCGVGFAPVRRHDHDKLVELMEGVEDIPGTALHEGLSWEWESIADYLDVLGRRSRDVDVAAQVTHGSLRLYVMGERGANREPATPDEIVEMGRVARAGIEAGALGFTTSRTLNHKTSKGEPTPTLTASVDELVGIATEIGLSGHGVLQVVTDFPDFEREFAMFREMVAASGRPLSVSLAQAGKGDFYRQVLAAIDAANRDGLPIRAQVAARAVGVLFGFQASLNPFMGSPTYRTVHDLPFSDRMPLLRDPVFRARVLDDLAERGADRGERGRPGPAWDRMFELGDPPDYEPDPSTSVAARAAARGMTAADLAYDILLGDEGRAFLYMPSLNWAGGNLDAVREMLVDPNTVPGLGDGGAHVGFISDGSFPTTLLAHWCRDRSHDRLDVPSVVKAQCRDTAVAVGLLDRGLLAPGHKADLNVIDFDRLGLRPPEMRYDLPAGGKRLLQRATGYRHTIVSGVETYHDGEPTEALPGRLVRGERGAPS